MDPVTWAIIATTASAASGAVGYMGARNQAKAMDQQAKYAEQMGTYNQAVARNQAQAEAQDLAHQSSVAKFNQQQTLQDRDFKYGLRQDKLEANLASARAQSVRKGAFDYSFDDILRAEEDFQQASFMNEFAQGSERAYGFMSQAKQNEFMGRRAIEIGNQHGALALSEGRSRATAYRNQASSARLSGIGSAIGGVAGAAGSLSSINMEGGLGNYSNWSMRQ